MSDLATNISFKFRKDFMQEKCPMCKGRRFLYHGSLRIDDFSYEREPCPECNVPYSVTKGDVRNSGFVEAEEVIGEE